ncbi:MAG: hypothetical protein WDZ58_01935 [Gemmatimonadaceae bacterium]
MALPGSELAPGYRQVVFDWEFEQGDARMRGEGVVRIAPPDSARLDLFLGGGFGGGAAILVGDELRAPLVESARRLIPPAPMLWAALGASPSRRRPTRQFALTAPPSAPTLEPRRSGGSSFTVPGWRGWTGLMTEG